MSKKTDAHLEKAGIIGQPKVVSNAIVYGLVLFVFLLPLWFLGWNVVLQINRFMTSPIIAGTVPAWVIFVGVIILYFILKRR